MDKTAIYITETTLSNELVLIYNKNSLWIVFRQIHFYKENMYEQRNQRH